MRRPILLILLVFGTIAGGATMDVASASRPPSLLAQLRPASPPADWRPLTPPSKSSVLWYPPFMHPMRGDAWSVSAALRDSKGTVLVYLNAGPSTGNPHVSSWPSFRVDHLREERNQSVHEDARATGVRFWGGKGSCVIDDYLTRVGPNHYREIACLVQGRTTASVLVAATLVSAWPRYKAQIERAVESWEVR